MIRLTRWHQICAYVAADAALNVSARVFQIYCTWYFLKVVATDGALSSVLLTVWITSTVLLPFSGVLGDRVKKSFILLAASLLSTTSAVLSFVAVNSLYEPASNHRLLSALIAIGVISSTSIALIFPLGTPLIPEISSSEADIHRGMRLKSSMFIVNLLFGPTLAGLVIGRFGGEAALALGLIAAAVGLVLSLLFLYSFRPQQAKGYAQARPWGILRDLWDGARRVAGIGAERAIAIASLFANMLLVPFLFLLLPAKIIGGGRTMLELAGVELALGAGVLAASTMLIHRLQRLLTEHGIASLGVVVLGLSILAFGYVESLWAQYCFAFSLGAGLTTFNVTVNTKRASAIPNGYRGTMESTLLFVCTLAAPAGLWVSKAALEKVSPNSVILAGSCVFLIAIAAIAFSKSLRRMLNAPQADIPYYTKINASLF